MLLSSWSKQRVPKVHDLVSAYGEIRKISRLSSFIFVFNGIDTNQDAVKLLRGYRIIDSADENGDIGICTVRRTPNKLMIADRESFDYTLVLYWLHSFSLFIIFIANPIPCGLVSIILRVISLHGYQWAQHLSVRYSCRPLP